MKMEKYAQTVTKNNLSDYLNNPAGSLFLASHPEFQLSDGSGEHLDGVGADGNLYVNDFTVQNAPNPISEELAMEMMDEYDIYFIAGGATLDLAQEAISKRRQEEEMERQEAERQREQDERDREELEFLSLPFGF